LLAYEGISTDGTHRLVLNLKDLNRFILNEHFKMEDSRVVCDILSKNDYLSKIDLKNAFHLVPVDDASRKYLRFIWKNKLYQYTCLPFGLCTAPRVFTKVIKPIIGYLREKGYKSVAYLDDFLLLGKTSASCKQNFVFTKNLFEKLGFIVNLDKSCDTPAKIVQYLGLIFNTIDLNIYLPTKKAQNVRKLCKNSIKQPVMSIRVLSQLIGNLVASCPAVRYGSIYIKQLEYEKVKALNASNNNYDSTVLLSTMAVKDLEWWLQTDLLQGRPIRQDRYTVELFSDASKSGWGGHMNLSVAKGSWSINEQSYHINVLELLAAFNCHRSFIIPQYSSVLLRLDSITAIAYINKQGGCRSYRCGLVAKEIWQ